MAQNSKARVAQANTVSREYFLEECHKLYTKPAESKPGLIHMAKYLNLTICEPKRKIIVLLLGNHSSGKSSYINWYIEEDIQKTGVAVETQGLTLVTSGIMRATLDGPTTLQQFPGLRDGVHRINGLVNYLTTEVSTSKQKKFSLVTFVDTPGLVDGNMRYEFNVNEAINWVGEMADLVFVFFDPIGQALCNRTLKIVKALHKVRGDRVRFYLSKADQAGTERDRQKVMMQIVLELGHENHGLNRAGFDMPTIYLPNFDLENKCANQIDETCTEVEKTINLMVQNAFSKLGNDCDTISRALVNKLKEDIESVNFNWWLAFRLLLLGILVGVICLVAWVLIPKPSVYQWVLLFIILVCACVIPLIMYTCKHRDTLPTTERKRGEEYQSFLQEYIQPQKQKLSVKYLESVLGEDKGKL